VEKNINLSGEIRTEGEKGQINTSIESRRNGLAKNEAWLKVQARKGVPNPGEFDRHLMLHKKGGAATSLRETAGGKSRKAPLKGMNYRRKVGRDSQTG